ncbi:hypothetical protein FRC12_008421, partial [Ceratobasidium sp. 428]
TWASIGHAFYFSITIGSTMAPLPLEAEARKHILYVLLFVDKIPAGDRGKLQKVL